MKNPTLFFDDPWLSLAGIALVVVVLYGELFFHELGHFLFARFLDYHIIGFSTGQGPVLRERLDPERPSFHRLRLWPVSGFVLPVKMRGHESRLQHFLVYFAGPFFSALFGLAIFITLRSVDFAAFPHPWGTVLEQVCQIALVLVGIGVIYNAVPNPTLAITNDGLGMLQALTQRGFPRPAFPATRVQNSLLADGDSGKLLLPVETTATGSHAFLKHLYYITLEQWSEANDHLEATLKDDRISTPERIAVLDCFADLVLTHQLRNHAPRATGALQEALDDIPDSLILRVRHASCQIADSFFDDGNRNLNFLEADTQNTHILACIACARAAADARQGRIEQAKSHYKKAQKLHRNCALSDFATTAIWSDFDPQK